MSLREKTCCFTGHRIIPNDMLSGLQRELREAVTSLVESGICFFGTRGAIGFDTLAAETVLSLQGKYLQIKLFLVLPCPEQADRWNSKDKERYESIKERADKVVYTSECYTPDCMHRRNRHLVDGSSVCVAYCTRNTGGTAYTVRYAQQHGLRIVRLCHASR